VSAVLLPSFSPDRQALAMIPGGNAPADDSWPAIAIPICLRLLEQLARRALSRADWIAGRSSPTRIPMIPITTSTSISVKPRRVRPLAGSPNASPRRTTVSMATPSQTEYQISLHNQPPSKVYTSEGKKVPAKYRRLGDCGQGV